MIDRNNTNSSYGRRDALKLGGLTVSAAAFLAACGNGRGGDDAPGRVGFAPPVEELEDFPVDDAVLLRTASSLELTAIAVYEAVLETGLLDADLTALVERLIEDHQMVADQMGELTEAVGGVAWECTNPWYMNRTVEPLLAAVLASDNPLRDIVNTAVVLENIAAGTHQSLTIQLEDTDAAAATIAAATLESRHSAYIVAVARGPEGYVSPLIDGDRRYPDRRRRRAAEVLDHHPVRFDRPGRIGGRRPRRERCASDVHRPDAVAQLLDLQRTRTHLLI